MADGCDSFLLVHLLGTTMMLPRFAGARTGSFKPLRRCCTAPVVHRDGSARRTAGAAAAVEGLGLGDLARRLATQPNLECTFVQHAHFEAAVAVGSRLAPPGVPPLARHCAIHLRVQLQNRVAAQTCVPDWAARPGVWRDSRGPVLPQPRSPLQCGEPFRHCALQVQ